MPSLQYYEILPLLRLPRAAAVTYTYSSPEKIPVGAIVKISFHGRSARGIIWKKCGKKPSYAVKTLTKIITNAEAILKHERSLITSLANHYITHPSDIARLYVPEKIPLKTLPKFVRKPAATASKKTPTLVQELLISEFESDFLRIKNSVVKNVELQKQTLILVATKEQLLACQRNLEKNNLKAPIFTLHSSQTITQQSKALAAAASETPAIFIGLRHSVFAPFCDLGLIVRYDASNDAYVQWDQHPKYSVDMVVQAMRTHLPISVIEFTYFPRSVLIKNADKPSWKDLASVHILEKHRTNQVFSPLHLRTEQLYVKYSGSKRWLFYLNRKGISRFIFCEDCSWQAQCPECKGSMIQTSGTKLACMRCLYSQDMPLTCPNCTSSNIKLFGVGTVKLAETLQTLRPDVRVMHLESETFNAKHFTQENTIIITDALAQMPATKSFDYVVMVNADGERALAAWNAEEQFLTRVWRLLAHTSRSGKLFLQTAEPNAISSILSEQNFLKYFDEQQRIRKKFLYPPFGEIIVISKKSAAVSVPPELQELQDYIKKQKNIFYVFQAFTNASGRWIRMTVRIPVAKESFKRKLYAIVPKDWRIDVTP